MPSQCATLASDLFEPLSMRAHPPKTSSEGETGQVHKHFSFFPEDTLPSCLAPGVFHYCAWRNVSIGVWVGEATLSAIDSLSSFGASMGTFHPHGYSSVVFILDRVPAPTRDAQKSLEKLFNARTSLACVAVVLEGTGFWASGIRGMITNAHRGATGTVKLNVTTSIEGVLSWLPPEHGAATGVALDVELLRRALLVARDQSAQLALNT
jgi:hypothetical protein